MMERSLFHAASKTSLKCYEEFIPKNLEIDTQLDKVGDDFRRKMKDFQQMRTSLFTKL